MSSMSLTEKVMSWEEDAEPELVADVHAAIKRGDVAWTWDPEVEDVAGLVGTHGSDEAFIVIYADNDWEVDEERCATLNPFKWSHIVAGNGYWGAGKSLAEAKKQFKAFGGRLSDGYIIAEGELSHVDNMGAIMYKWGTELKTTTVKARRS